MTDTGQRIARVVATVVLAAHLIGGIAALALLPHGFPPTDIHLWSNTVIPAAAVIATAVVLVRFLFLRAASLPVTVLAAAAAGGWMAAVITGVVLFPSSMTLARSAGAGAVALVLLGVAVWAKERTGATWGGLAAGAALGATVIFAQRAPQPSTRPAGGALVEMRGEATSDEAATGQIVVTCGKGKLRLNPLLTFQSRSPDRTWTELAPPALEVRRVLTHYAKTPDGFRASYTDDGASTLVAARDKSGVVLDIEAVSRLPEPVYAHANTSTAIHVTFDATVSFNPTGATRFSFDPPQLAYLGGDLELHVVRARDGEKAPFTEVMKGRLGRDEPLAIEIRPVDEKDKGCRVVLKDWTAQLSTEPSPTAGWGVPQNGIQLAKRGGEGHILVTLADSSRGAGTMSVGHAEGTYRNRIRIEPIVK